MANPQIPAWLLMNNPNQPTQPLRINTPLNISLDNPNQQAKPLKFDGPLNISLDSPNPGMSLQDADSIIAQQKQAEIMGLAPASQASAPIFMSERSPQDDELIKQISESYGQQQALQGEAIKSAEEQLAAARSQPQQLDLSPLIALSESWSGKPSRLLQTYQRPQDQGKNVQALQEAVLKARGGAAELSRMRAKDVQQLSQQERQMRVNEELKRMSIQAMMAGKDKKVDDKTYERELGLVDKISKSKEADVISGTIQMNNSVNNYIQTIRKHQNDLLSPEARSEIANAYESTIMAFKKAEALGALQKEDVIRAQAKLPEVATFSAAASRFGGLAPDVNSVIKVISQIPQEYGKRGKQALQNIKSGYGKFGGQDIISQYENDLNASMSGQSTGMSRQEKIDQLKRLQGISQ